MNNYAEKNILRLVEERGCMSLSRLQFTDIFGTAENVAVALPASWKNIE